MTEQVVQVLRSNCGINSQELEARIKSSGSFKRQGIDASIQKEKIRLCGEEFTVRRLFIKTATSGEYANVGWILDEDVSRCMICATEFSLFVSRTHCYACGNLVCSGCRDNEALIVELEDLPPQKVCNQCFWGQEPVYARHSRLEDSLIEDATRRWTAGSPSGVPNSSAGGGFPDEYFTDSHSSTLVTSINMSAQSLFDDSPTTKSPAAPNGSSSGSSSRNTSSKPITAMSTTTTSSIGHPYNSDDSDGEIDSTNAAPLPASSSSNSSSSNKGGTEDRQVTPGAALVRKSTNEPVTHTPSFGNSRDSSVAYPATTTGAAITGAASGTTTGRDSAAASSSVNAKLDETRDANTTATIDNSARDERTGAKESSTPAAIQAATTAPANTSSNTSSNTVSVAPAGPVETSTSTPTMQNTPAAHTATMTAAPSTATKTNSYDSDDDVRNPPASNPSAPSASPPALPPVTPTPFCCLKTRRESDNSKVFVNVLSLPKEYAQLGAVLMNGKDVSTDKNGVESDTYDVCVDYTVPETMDGPAREQIGAKILGEINDHYNDTLDLSFKTPKIKNNYKGSDVREYHSPGGVTSENDSVPTSSSLPPNKGLISTPSADTTGSTAPLTSSPSTPARNVAPAVVKGWLRKEGHSFKSWKRRYFVLSVGELAYYEKPMNVPPFGEKQKGVISLAGAYIDAGHGRKSSTDGGRSSSVDNSTANKRVYIVGAEGRDLKIEAEDEFMAQQWAEAIQEHIAYADQMRLPVITR